MINNLLHLNEWFKLSDETKKNAFTQTANELGLSPVAVEKDWWVVHTLALVFNMDCATYLVFKGGTSLSKGWNLIERFSEDIDLAISREKFGYFNDLTNEQVKKLRKDSCKYLSTEFRDELESKFIEAGFKNVSIKCGESKDTDQDPVVIEINYQVLTESDLYLKPPILLEIGTRSLKEPHTSRPIKTMIADRFSGRPFAEKAITIPVVNPERTLLEKIFLLHEEYQKVGANRKANRLSRHLYDIEKLSSNGFANIALADSDLYMTIVNHRKRFNKIKGVDYNNHTPSKIKIIPSDNLIDLWKKDYEEMQEMIYEKPHPLSFDNLILELEKLQNRINRLDWQM